ncbi:MAG TPA: adenylate/guanylate cyclase domain-containing protein [Solirubrobacteraceae bacterium]|nr:adenylate/guanylate cyclase domain-containing protein [Solirubrobacteraceae bacterium]
MTRLLRFLARKLGRRYPRLVLAVQFQVAHLVALFGLGVLVLYQDMTTAEFLRLVAASQAMVLLENLIGIRRAFTLLRPADRWLRGERDATTATAAWRALAALPVAYLRGTRTALLLAPSGLPFAVYATWELDLQWYAAPILLAGAIVVELYSLALRYFAMELAMRPVLERIAPDLPRDFEIGRDAVSLGLKLLVAVPAFNIITGVVVSGLSTDGQATLRDLGLDILVAVAIAFTTSFYLTLLLARSVLGPIRELRRATQAVAGGDLSVRVPVISADETGELVQSFNAAVAGLEERERLHDAFGSYVAPGVADQVLRDGAALDGEEIEVSVLFLDIRDFTAFAERSDAREVVATLNELFGEVVPLVTRHGGHANKFVGDGLLAVFGAPARHDDHADRAVAAAREIAECVRSGWAGRLRVGIGVNSGPVVAGTIGGGGKLEFTVIGDTVNTAARVEALTRRTGDDVLITEATRRRMTRDGDEWAERPAATLRGKSEPVRVFAAEREPSAR